MIARILFAVFLAAICSGTLVAEEVVNVGSEIFHLAFTASNDEGSIKEFVPEGETIHNWSTLVAVRYFNHLHSPEDYIRNMAEDYRQLMPHMQFAMSQLDQADVWDIDFIMYERGRTSGFLEWNYFRAERPGVGEGIVVNQYVVRRPYSRSISEAFDDWDLPSFRKQMLPVLKQAEFRIVGGESSEQEDEQ
ncbi:MAG: hypothetical protein F4X98_07325 [Gammaproteobacteria bacterium]|nr:hypothetical protein [Gammaproteobacteria bacterium]